MYWNTQHNIFCDIISIGDTFITISANGYEYVSSMHFMILMGQCMTINTLFTECGTKYGSLPNTL